MSHSVEIEQGSQFLPKFDAAGLLTAVAQHADTGEILMLAHVNQEAIDQTLATGKAHFYSRSRAKQWMKGEESGNTLSVQQILIDCDQDALIFKVLPVGPACHTGAKTCFYRELSAEGLARI